MFGHDGLVYGKCIGVSKFGFLHLAVEKAGADFAATLFLYDQFEVARC